MNKQAEQLIEAATSRNEQKRLGRMLDDSPALRQAVFAVARARGIDLPDDAVDWPGKKLLRRARGRDVAAQQISNPIALDEAFVCLSCGRDVPRHGRSARDHCPFCLAGRHVDAVVPGDRASTCGAELVAVGVEQRRGRWMLLYRCSGCGATRTNQVLMDGVPPDHWPTVVALTGALP